MNRYYYEYVFGASFVEDYGILEAENIEAAKALLYTMFPVDEDAKDNKWHTHKDNAGRTWHQRFLTKPVSDIRDRRIEFYRNYHHGKNSR